MNKLDTGKEPKWVTEYNNWETKIHLQVPPPKPPTILSLLEGRRVKFGLDKQGKVILIYNDAVASGTNEYIQITCILIQDDENKIHNVYPRDITEVLLF
jgi:hypothetical protein